INHPTPAALTTHLRAQLLPAPEASAARLLAEIAGLRTALSAATVSNEEHTAVATGIQELLRPWNGTRAAPPTTGSRGDDFAPAADEELFAALANELGVPGLTRRPDNP